MHFLYQLTQVCEQAGNMQVSPRSLLVFVAEIQTSSHWCIYLEQTNGGKKKKNTA